MTNYHTDFLTATPSIVLGAGSIMNIGDSYYDFNQSKSPEEADAKAIASDRGMIGSDIWNALIKCRQLDNGKAIDEKK